MSQEESEVARQQALEQLRHLHEAYDAVFTSPFGKKVLEDLDRFCTTFRESVHMDAQRRMDPYTTIYRDGKKAVALRIRQMMEWNEHGNGSRDSE